MSETTLPEPVPPAPPRGKTKWFAFVALAVALGAFLFLAVGGIGENLVYYWAPKDLRAAGVGDRALPVRLDGLQPGPTPRRLRRPRRRRPAQGAEGLVGRQRPQGGVALLRGPVPSDRAQHIRGNDAEVRVVARHPSVHDDSLPIHRFASCTIV